MNKFIATELFDRGGEAGEKLVWDSIKRSFERRSCLVYWRYPIFSLDRLRFRKEPDILICDRHLGLIVIEVKAIRIEQLVAIQGHRWQYRDFYTDSGNPYQQAENQLFGILEYCDREPLLKRQVSARATVALPYITRTQWQEKGWFDLPSSPPILFAEDLVNVNLAGEFLARIPPVILGTDLTPTQWELLQAVLGGTALYTPPLPPFKSSSSRLQMIRQVRSRLNQLDLQQEQIAKQIPPGMQRIRGIAGSGKTVILCQKAALMSVRYPEWQIALVFFSRSLYESITQQVDRWIRHFTQDRLGYNAESGLKILHAWGSKQQPGFYGTVCKAAGTMPLSVPFTLSSPPHEALAEACLQLLENRSIPQMFDAVLIDEAQDLMADTWHYQNKQPFFWLAYQALRPVNPVSPQQRRLIWAYDELQSMGSLKLPEPVELFGEELGHLVTGQYNQQINKTEIICRSYRTPQPIITVAQAIALGLLRAKGLLTGSLYAEEWAALGYQLTGTWRLGEQITLAREINPPNIISELWSEPLIDFKRCSSRQQELSLLAQKLKQNLTTEQIQPERSLLDAVAADAKRPSRRRRRSEPSALRENPQDRAASLLVIVLGSTYEANTLLKQTATFLINQGIQVYLPSQRTYNSVDSAQQDNPNQFWYPGSVTVSTIHRAKGQEADLVYLVALDRIAAIDNIHLRHQLLVALTRTRAWVEISGIGDYPLYRELDQLIPQQQTITFTVTSQPQRELRISDRANLIQGYALGRRNFRHANLSYADLSQTHLANINLIDANLSHANLSRSNLTNAKLIAANLAHANLTNANLTNAKLMGADLTDAILTGVNLDRAKQ